LPGPQNGGVWIEVYIEFQMREAGRKKGGGMGSGIEIGIRTFYLRDSKHIIVW